MKNSEDQNLYRRDRNLALVAFFWHLFALYSLEGGSVIERTEKDWASMVTHIMLGMATLAAAGASHWLHTKRTMNPFYSVIFSSMILVICAQWLFSLLIYLASTVEMPSPQPIREERIPDFAAGNMAFTLILLIIHVLPLLGRVGYNVNFLTQTIKRHRAYFA